MIGVEELAQILELAIISAAINGEQNPVSVMIIAPPESGKSELIKRFEKQPWTYLINDFTGWGLAKKVLPAFRDPIKHVRVLLIPDFTNILARSGGSVESTLHTLASLIQEGLTETQTKFISFQNKHPTYGSIITSITPRDFSYRRKHWIGNGFFSRFLALSYTYDAETLDRIRGFINTGVRMNGLYSYTFPTKPLEVGFDPKIFRPFNQFSQEYASAWRLSNDTQAYGFRVLTNLQRLAKASAIRQKREIVTQYDIDLVIHLITKYSIDEAKAGIQVEMV